MGRARLGRRTIKLTHRELTVGHLLSVGLTAYSIGERLNISHRTVESHIMNIYGKLAVHTRGEFVRKWITEIENHDDRTRT